MHVDDHCVRFQNQTNFVMGDSTGLRTAPDMMALLAPNRPIRYKRFARSGGCCFGDHRWARHQTCHTGEDTAIGQASTNSIFVIVARCIGMQLELHLPCGLANAKSLRHNVKSQLTHFCICSGFMQT